MKPIRIQQFRWHLCRVCRVLGKRLQERSPVVLLAKFYPPDNRNQVRLVLSISHAYPGRKPMLLDCYVCFSVCGPST